MAKIKESDWHNEASEDYTVAVDFPDGSTKHLTMDAAAERLADQWDRDTAKRLLSQGHTLTRWTGASYHLISRVAPETELETRAAYGDR